MATKTIAKAGRSWRVGLEGLSSLKRVYQVCLDDVVGIGSEGATFPGVPALKSPHPNNPRLIATSYDVEEPTDAAKKCLNVTVNYELPSYEFSTDEEEVESQVEEWGWDGGTDSRELVIDAAGTPVLNSAGDPFESVPSVTVSAPSFTKVVKFKARQSGALSHSGKLNNSEITIGDKVCAPGTLLATVAERRIFGASVYHYQYAINLRYKTNKVVLGSDETETEIGWDVAITDAGMQVYVNAGDELGDEKKLATVIDRETGKTCNVTSPVLLDGTGHQATSAYNLKFATAARADFPSWFYDEPAIATES